MTTRENISLWLDHSRPDYYLFFIKAWIPFNSWYVLEYPELKKRDNDIIKKLQDDPSSKPRLIISNLITNGSEFESKKFRSHLAELHFHLEQNPILHNGNRLTFTELKLTQNTITSQTASDRAGNVYKAENIGSYFQAYIEDKVGKVLLDYKSPKYDIELLKKDTAFIRLSHLSKDKITNLFTIINPNKPINLISTSRFRSEKIPIDSVNKCNFINDPVVIAKGVIKVLYALRCMLFQGELPPNNTNRSIYENAYYMLKIINDRNN